MADSAVESRLERAEQILREKGFASPAVRVSGHEGEIAAVSISRQQWERLIVEGNEIGAELRRLGFRYVALDLAPQAS